MFKWLKGRREHKLTALDILEKYGALLETHAGSYMDETWLPVDKDQMRLAFKAAWKMTQNDKLRNHIEVAWVSLSMFQPGVGQIPIDGAAPKLKDTPQNIARFDRFMQLHEIGQPQAEKELAAIREFKKSN